MNRAIATIQVLLVLMCVMVENGESFLRGGREVIANKQRKQIPQWVDNPNLNTAEMRRLSSLNFNRETVFAPPRPGLKGNVVAPPPSGRKFNFAASPSSGMRGIFAAPPPPSKLKAGKVCLFSSQLWDQWRLQSVDSSSRILGKRSENTVRKSKLYLCNHNYYTTS